MKLIIDIDDNIYELINKTGITPDWHTIFHGKEKDKEMTFAIFDLVKALKNGIPYEEKPQGKWFDCIENTTLKARHGEFVLYKVDYLLNNLTREIYLLESVRRMLGGDT